MTMVEQYRKAVGSALQAVLHHLMPTAPLSQPSRARSSFTAPGRSAPLVHIRLTYLFPSMLITTMCNVRSSCQNFVHT